MQKRCLVNRKRPLQAAKEALEQRQRADAKLRKEGGCSHGH